MCCRDTDNGKTRGSKGRKKKAHTMLLASILLNPSSDKTKPTAIDLERNICTAVKETL